MVLEDGLTGLMLTVELLLVAAGEALGDQALLSLFEETQLWVLARRTEYVPCDKSRWGKERRRSARVGVFGNKSFEFKIV